MDEVVSGEGVVLDLARAGVGSRMVAVIVDGLIQAGALLAFGALDGVLGGDDAVLAALLVVEIVLVLGVYPTVSEWLTRGRTLGKAAMGLRVVRDDGGPIGFRHALVRGLSGLLLEKPGLIAPLGTAAGLITTMAGSSSKRIGDHLAGTFVLNERAGTQDQPFAPTFWVPPHLYGWAMSMDLSGLDDGLALEIREFVLRAHRMTPAAQQQIGEALRRRATLVVSPPPPAWEPTPIVLTTIMAERRRRADLAQVAAPR